MKDKNVKYYLVAYTESLWSGDRKQLPIHTYYWAATDESSLESKLNEMNNYGHERKPEIHRLQAEEMYSHLLETEQWTNPDKLEKFYTFVQEWNDFDGSDQTITRKNYVAHQKPYDNLQKLAVKHTKKNDGERIRAYQLDRTYEVGPAIRSWSVNKRSLCELYNIEL